MELNACRSKISDKQLVPLERPVPVVITTISTNPAPAKYFQVILKKPAKTSKDPKKKKQRKVLVVMLVRAKGVHPLAEIARESSLVIV